MRNHPFGQRRGNGDQSMRTARCLQHSLSRKGDLSDEVDVAAARADHERQAQFLRHLRRRDPVRIEVVRIDGVEPARVEAAVARLIEQRASERIGLDSHSDRRDLHVARMSNLESAHGLGRRHPRSPAVGAREPRNRRDDRRFDAPGVADPAQAVGDEDPLTRLPRVGKQRGQRQQADGRPAILRRAG